MASDTTEELTPEALNSAPFGTLFSENMTICHYRNGAWGSPSIEPVAPLSLHPGAHVLHYASACFEGLKAFRRVDSELHGSPRIFRLEQHVQRMQESARLLCLPVPDPEILTSMITDLVRDSAGSMPVPPGALYLRPTLIGTEVNVGAAGAPPAEVCLYVLASPVGDYFSGGLRPLNLLVEDRHPRTTSSFGMAKTGANYASALRHVVAARDSWGADTVLFCPDGDVQETGASNFFLVDDHTLLTKPLDSSYLHGVTRDAVLTIARDLGYDVIERDYSVTEMLEWVTTGEAAISGTAAVLGGVGTLIHDNRRIDVADGSVGPNTRRLREALVDVQLGRSNDRHGWLSAV